MAWHFDLVYTTSKHLNIPPPHNMSNSPLRLLPGIVKLGRKDIGTVSRIIINGFPFSHNGHNTSRHSTTQHQVSQPTAMDTLHGYHTNNDRRPLFLAIIFTRYRSSQRRWSILTTRAVSFLFLLVVVIRSNNETCAGSDQRGITIHSFIQAGCHCLRL